MAASRKICLWNLEWDMHVFINTKYHQEIEIYCLRPLSVINSILVGGVGIGVTFLTAKDEDFKDFPSIYKPIPNLFVSYDFLRFKHFSVFAQLQGAYSKDNIHYDGYPYPPYPHNHNLWECGIRFGAAYELNRHFSARLRYLFIGYSKRSDHDSYRRGVVGDNDFIMDAGLRPLQLSVRYTF